MKPGLAPKVFSYAGLIGIPVVFAIIAIITGKPFYLLYALPTTLVGVITRVVIYLQRRR